MSLPVSESASVQPVEHHIPTRPEYHPYVLRAQMAILRREAAARAESEAEINAAYETATAAARDAADRALAATREKHAADIESTRRKHAEVQRQAEEFRTTEQKKLDEFRRSKTKAIKAACEQRVIDLKEEEDFEQMRFKEVVKSKAHEPQHLAAAAEQKLAAALAQLDEAASAAEKRLAAWGVKF